MLDPVQYRIRGALVGGSTLVSSVRQSLQDHLLSGTDDGWHDNVGESRKGCEQKIEVPQNFRKQLGARLRRLVQQDKLEKVDSLYRLKNNPVETNAGNRKDSWARQHLTAVYSKVGESLEEAAKTAAFKVVEAETKSYMAAEAVKEAEKFSKLAEETDSTLQFAKEIFERCTRGELVAVAT
ncbi:Telomere repeat-binding factor 5 [Bienertia sinuspersici]